MPFDIKPRTGLDSRLVTSTASSTSETLTPAICALLTIQSETYPTGQPIAQQCEAWDFVLPVRVRRRRSYEGVGLSPKFRTH
jgi:hypothetical protein